MYSQTTRNIYIDKRLKNISNQHLDTNTKLTIKGLLKKQYRDIRSVSDISNNFKTFNTSNNETKKHKEKKKLRNQSIVDIQVSKQTKVTKEDATIVSGKNVQSFISKNLNSFTSNDLHR